MDRFTIILPFSIHTFLRALQLLILFLIIMGLISAYMHLNSSSQSAQFFYLDKEGNVPAFFSAILLFTAGCLAWLIRIFKKHNREKFTLHWTIISILLLLLSIDEVTGVHEFVTYFLHERAGAEGPSQFAWAAVGGTLVLLFVLTFARFILTLPRPTLFRFAAGGITYVTGALVLEYIGGKVIETYGDTSTAYMVSTTIEESLEMVGIYLIIRAMLYYISENLLDRQGLLLCTDLPTGKKEQHQALS